MDKNSYSLLSKKHNENEISLSFKTKPENSQTQCPLVSMNHNENSSITTDTPSYIPPLELLPQEGIQMFPY